MGRVLRLQGDKTSHGILFSYTEEALVRGYPRDVKNQGSATGAGRLWEKSTEFAWELRKPGVFEGVRK